MEKFTEKKKKNQVLARFIRKFLSESSWELVQDCNTFMMMVADETLEKKKQHKGNTCKNRFCPVCSWKKARREALSLAVQMEYIKDTYNKDFIFLTLTTPNVKAEELHDEIKEYNHAFQKLVKRTEVQSVVKGYIRKLEVTYNQDRDDYNPHFHVLIAVNKSYFNKPNQYIKQDRWLKLWQEVTKNPFITNVHVQKVRTNSKKEVAELAKYSAKDSDYLASEKVFDSFYKGLKGKQLMVYSGLFKESNKLFKDGELDHYKDQDPTEYIYALLYHWGQGSYVEEEKRLLTAQERKEVNGQLMEDQDVED
jgi:plasmid rolling circle replication initiator protein Rep